MSIPHLIVIIGPTAVGKTALAVRVAQAYGTEVLSADSRQFYREMNIGTAKPTSVEMQGVPHHFIDRLSIKEEYTAGMFEEDALHVLEDLFTKRNTAVMVGGSGMYVDAVCKGIDPMPPTDERVREELNDEYQRKGLLPLLDELKKKDPDHHEHMDRNNPRRVIRALEVIRSSSKPYSSFRKGAPAERPFHIIKLGLWMERDELYERINARVDKMVEAGLEEEARQLYPYKDEQALRTVGYQEWWDHFDGTCDRATVIERIKKHTRQYAKRQLTWFRRDPSVHWFKPDEQEAALQMLHDKIPSS